ncbi:MAG: hypothetical protein EZS28_018039 [Streblomastix strix]|uniref:Uncharacterized protein n=1 Tax=Streblomastix strix TaxID=222440 RepID=A0A5J4VV85_9EUKA|nr:MAG: hypothetical protein EZS28_018039 [Streblomastix strix]
MWQVQGNILDMIVTISFIADDFSGVNWNTGQLRYKNLLFYMRANIPITITEVIKMIGIEYCESADRQALISVIIAAFLGFIALIVPLVVIISQFVNTIMKLKSERHKVFFHLVRSKKSEFFNLKKRLDDVEKDDEAETLSLLSQTEQSQLNINEDIVTLEKKNKKKDNDDENFDLLEDDNDQDDQELKQRQEEDENELNNNIQLNQNNGLMNFGSGINMNGDKSAIQQQLQLQMMQFQLMQQQQQQQIFDKAGKSGMMNSMTMIQPDIDEIRVRYQITDQDNKGGSKKYQNEKQKDISEKQKVVHAKQILRIFAHRICSYYRDAFIIRDYCHLCFTQGRGIQYCSISKWV